jgi:3-hydroxyacyl-CoA dehydrogenase/3a,7a,12a-trihydroxy-5b-cholest-24-enoyl-CoA hydratase
MSGDLSFEGRVVIITGAGQGLGRAYALAFAKRGAKVMVNDLGITMDGKSHLPTRIADLVVDEIKKLGGTAIANYDSVEDAERIVQETIKHWGRIDILINNAGILRDKAFQNMKFSDYKQVIKTHLNGTFMMCRCVWPYMRQQLFGRIVNTSSVAGIYGNFGQANYSTAKLAIHGLTNTLALEGESKNIMVSTIAPIAATRMTQGVLPNEIFNSVSVEHIVPVVEWLAHPDNTTTGGLYEVGGGWVSKLRWQRSNGVSFDFPFTAENVRDRIEEICDFEKDAEVPENPKSGMFKMYSNYDRNTKKLGKTQTAASDLKSTPIFQLMNEFLRAEGDKVVEKIKAIFNFEILPAKGKPVDTCWTIDVKNGKGSVTQGKAKDADATFQMLDEDYIQLVDGKLNPQMAFLSGKMKIKGNMKKATAFTPDLFPKPTPENMQKYLKGKL